MYKANGVTKVFPLPVGADGRVVALSMESGVVRMQEGDAYAVVDGSVVFSVAPPEGVTVVFDVQGNSAPMQGVCTVVYPDGRLRVVAQDPYELLLASTAERDAAQKLLREALGAHERAEHLVYTEAQMAKDKMQIGLIGYSTQAEAAIQNAAVSAKEELTDQFSKNLLEIRNKHKAVLAAHADLEAFALRAEEAAEDAATKAVQGVLERCALMDAALEEIRRLRAEALDFRDAARNAAENAGVGVAKAFSARAEVVLEELRSLKATVSGEVSAIIQRAKEDVNADMERMRGLKADMSRASKRFEEAERNVRTVEDRIAAREVRKNA